MINGDNLFAVTLKSYLSQFWVLVPKNLKAKIPFAPLSYLCEKDIRHAGNQPYRLREHPAEECV